MIALTFAVALQSQTVMPPRGSQSVDEVRVISQYIAAVTTKASILRACADFVDPDSIDQIRDDLVELPEVTHVKEQFAALVSASLDRSGRYPLEGAPTSEKCQALIDLVDSRLEELLPSFRATLPIFVGEAP